MTLKRGRGGALKWQSSISGRGGGEQGGQLGVPLNTAQMLRKEKDQPEFIDPSVAVCSLLREPAFALFLQTAQEVNRTALPACCQMPWGLGCSQAPSAFLPSSRAASSSPFSLFSRIVLKPNLQIGEETWPALVNAATNWQGFLPRQDQLPSELRQPERCLLLGKAACKLTDHGWA